MNLHGTIENSRYAKKQKYAFFCVSFCFFARLESVLQSIIVMAPALKRAKIDDAGKGKGKGKLELRFNPEDQGSKKSKK